MPQPLKPQLAELQSKWCSFDITKEFHRVHHFSQSGKRETLAKFIEWSDDAIERRSR